MASFYIDDSVHDKENFIVGACVYTEEFNINSSIDRIIATNGYNHAEFEFKSSDNYSKHREKIKVRNDLKHLINAYCKLGIVIIPRDKRNLLGFECLKAVKQFIDNNQIKTPISIFFDQGMFGSINGANKLFDNLNFKDCVFYPEQDSKIIKGIQLADLSAHICAIKFKCELGFLSKTVKAGENSGYDPDTEIELPFEMWATLRHVFFCKEEHLRTNNHLIDATFKVEPNGLCVSDLCSDNFKEKIRSSFGEVYLGCIHQNYNSCPTIPTFTTAIASACKDTIIRRQDGTL